MSKNPLTPEQFAAEEGCSTRYLIQCFRNGYNDTVLWWRPEHSGYTHSVNDAGRYTHAEAVKISPPDHWHDDMPWRERDVDDAARSVVFR